MDFHPGGDEELMRGIGKDATELFNQVHAWVNYESLLHKCYVGRLIYSESNSGPPIISKASNLIGKLFIKKGKSNFLIRLNIIFAPIGGLYEG